MTGRGDPTLFQLSFPLFLQSLVMFSVMVADLMIWSAHGPETAAALSVAGQVLRVAVEVSTILGIGAVILISRQLGRGEAESARRIAAVAIMANALAGVCLGAGLALAGPFALTWMGLDPGIKGQGALYLRMTGAAMVFLCIGNAAISCLRAFGASRVVMRLGVLGAGLYLLLEYLLVLGPGPLPALGVMGAGAANLAMRIIVALALLIVVVRMLKLTLRPALLRGAGGQVRRMAALASPSVGDFIAYSVYQMVVIGLVATGGEAALLTRAYVMTAMAFLTLVIMAVCQGTEVLVGYRLGRNDHVGAQALGLRGAAIAAGLAMGSAAVIWLASSPFVGLFTADPEIHASARRLLFLTIPLQLCCGVNMILFHALRAAEDVRWPVLVSQGLTWGMGLPLCWLFSGPAGLGLDGIWLAFIVEEAAKAAAMFWRWKRRGLNQAHL